MKKPIWIENGYAMTKPLPAGSITKKYQAEDNLN